MQNGSSIILHKPFRDNSFAVAKFTNTKHVVDLCHETIQDFTITLLFRCRTTYFARELNSSGSLAQKMQLFLVYGNWSLEI